MRLNLLLLQDQSLKCLKTQEFQRDFAIEQSKRYVATVNVRLEIFDGSRRIATINAETERSHTLEKMLLNLKTAWYTW